ncbi:MAG: colanic acid/amylovoran biosynthesis protein [Verrucomicrobiota bacterium]|jgi:colanic acid/amylovoran biosynthesis protein
MRVVITNAVTSNGGDAAILLGMMKLLRTALGSETQFVIFDSQPDLAKRHYPELEFRELWRARAIRLAGRRARKLRRAFHLARIRVAAKLQIHGAKRLAAVMLTHEEKIALEDFSAADLVVSTGGTYLVEHYSLKSRLFEFELALALRKPLVLFTQSLGPFRKPENRRALANVLRRAAGVLVRDEASRNHLASLDVPPEKIRLAADAAFALETGPPSFPTPAPFLRVAISVRNWSHFKEADRDAGMNRFTEAMTALTSHLVQQHGARVTFISTCQGIPEYAFDDSQIADVIAGALPDAVRERVRVDAGFHRPEELIQRLQEFDMVVATRMHLAILSLLAGTPVLPVSYEFKTTELFGRLGMARWVQDIETIDPLGLIATADQFVGELPALRGAVRSAVERERLEAASAVEAVQYFSGLR